MSPGSPKHSNKRPPGLSLSSQQPRAAPSWVFQQVAVPVPETPTSTGSCLLNGLGLATRPDDATTNSSAMIRQRGSQELVESGRAAIGGAPSDFGNDIAAASDVERISTQYCSPVSCPRRRRAGTAGADMQSHYRVGAPGQQETVDRVYQHGVALGAPLPVAAQKRASAGQLEKPSHFRKPAVARPSMVCAWCACQSVDRWAPRLK
ncbi:MAG: hypothetical protein M1822_007427 [Bathelium mastoideum]|nr:MAG: hypothetical protein M1822_007427 [Bathelium mastoideum]